MAVGARHRRGPARRRAGPRPGRRGRASAPGPPVDALSGPVPGPSRAGAATSHVRRDPERHRRRPPSGTGSAGSREGPAHEPESRQARALRRPRRASSVDASADLLRKAAIPVVSLEQPLAPRSSSLSSIRAAVEAVTPEIARLEQASSPTSSQCACSRSSTASASAGSASSSTTSSASTPNRSSPRASRRGRRHLGPLAGRRRRGRSSARRVSRPSTATPRPTWAAVSTASKRLPASTPPRPPRPTSPSGSWPPPRHRPPHPPRPQRSGGAACVNFRA